MLECCGPRAIKCCLEPAPEMLHLMLGICNIVGKAQEIPEGQSQVRLRRYL